MAKPRSSHKSARLYRYREDEHAVSPVIAIILMVAITVVLAGVLYVWVTTFMPTAKGGAPPRAIGICDRDTYGYFVVTLQEVSREVGLDGIEYMLLDRDEVKVVKGDVTDDDVYNVKYADFCFVDSPGYGYLSSGDKLRVKSIDAGGIAESGYYVRLIFTPTDSTILNVELT